MYVGDKEERADLAHTAKKQYKTGSKPFDVLLTTYEASIVSSMAGTLFLPQTFCHLYQIFYFIVFDRSNFRVIPGCNLFKIILERASTV